MKLWHVQSYHRRCICPGKTIAEATAYFVDHTQTDVQFDPEQLMPTKVEYIGELLVPEGFEFKQCPIDS